MAVFVIVRSETANKEETKERSGPREAPDRHPGLVPRPADHFASPSRSACASASCARLRRRNAHVTRPGDRYSFPRACRASCEDADLVTKAGGCGTRPHGSPTCRGRATGPQSTRGHARPLTSLPDPPRRSEELNARFQSFSLPQLHVAGPGVNSVPPQTLQWPWPRLRRWWQAQVAAREAAGPGRRKGAEAPQLGGAGGQR